jgi:twitching motility two-component system response regulator PilG
VALALLDTSLGVPKVQHTPDQGQHPEERVENTQQAEQAGLHPDQIEPEAMQTDQPKAPASSPILSSPQSGQPGSSLFQQQQSYVSPIITHQGTIPSLPDQPVPVPSGPVAAPSQQSERINPTPAPAPSGPAVPSQSVPGAMQSNPPSGGPIAKSASSQPQSNPLPPQALATPAVLPATPVQPQAAPMPLASMTPAAQSSPAVAPPTPPPTQSNSPTASPKLPRPQTAPSTPNPLPTQSGQLASRPVLPRSQASPADRAPVPPQGGPQAAQQPGQSQGVDRQNADAKVIMVVDDSQTVRNIMALILHRVGYRSVRVASAMEALHTLTELIPDLIFLDITLPGMDGLDVCKIIKENPRTKDVPVVMLSGNNEVFDKVMGRLAGASDYITKPFEPESILKCIQAFCGQKHRLREGLWQGVH